MGFCHPDIELRIVEGKERGMYATCDIKYHTMLMSDKAIA